MRNCFLITIVLFFALSCAKDKGIDPNQLTDAKLFDLSSNTSILTKYKKLATNDSVFAGGQHGGSYVMFFNTKAYLACTDNGKLPAGQTFPDSSLVVKAVGNPVSLYAVFFKKNGVWKYGEYTSNWDKQSSPIFSVNSSSNVCFDCHKAASRDLIFTFD